MLHEFLSWLFHFCLGCSKLLLERHRFFCLSVGNFGGDWHLCFGGSEVRVSLLELLFEG